MKNRTIDGEEFTAPYGIIRVMETCGVVRVVVVHDASSVVMMVGNTAATIAATSARIEALEGAGTRLRDQAPGCAVEAGFDWPDSEPMQAVAAWDALTTTPQEARS